MTRFPTEFQNYVYISRYARYLHDQKRRETWPETVNRYFDFMAAHLKDRCGYILPSELLDALRIEVMMLGVMPSMRCLMSAGAALARDEMAGFNCSFLMVDSPRTFSEILYVLMVGTGVGFSVERQFISKLPEVPEKLYDSDTTIVVSDSKIGWAKALHELITMLYNGSIPRLDLSRVRPAGTILRIFGGRASGPEPLRRLLSFAITIFRQAVGRKLTSIECHDLICMIGEAVVVGGVRRSALISLSNLSDDRMRAAKSGQWWTMTPWRSLANNSAVYTDRRPSMDVFMHEWLALYESKSGERGIFSRFAARNVIERSNAFRKLNFGGVDGIRYRDLDHEWGCNPCSEILLRDREVCNLTEIVVRATDTLDDLLRKAKAATILGTFQSTLTNYRFLPKKWQFNAEDERLLGVSLTGQMDHNIMSGRQGETLLKDWLTALRSEVIRVNIAQAKALGIHSATASTCVKPSGTVSSLVNAAAGIHGRHSAYYLRRIRSDKKDPVAALMIDAGMPYESDKMRPDHNWVFSFPQRSPGGALTRDDRDAISQLKIWLLYQMYWTDHKPSITVSVKDHEWLRVGAWVFDNFEYMSGVSFLPNSDHIYEQAPYQDLTEAEYTALTSKIPAIDWSALPRYEENDSTSGSQELTCTAGGCDL